MNDGTRGDEKMKNKNNVAERVIFILVNISYSFMSVLFFHYKLNFNNKFYLAYLYVIFTLLYRTMFLYIQELIKIIKEEMKK